MWVTIKNSIKKIAKLLSTRIVFITMLGASVFLMPLAANGQLGTDPCCTIISVGLRTIASLLNSGVANPLGNIQQSQYSTSTFEQQVVYPVSSIAKAQGLAGLLNGQIQQVTRYYQMPIASATLPGTSQLELSLLSHNPLQNAQLTLNYATVYGKVTASGNAPAEVRNMMDMSDAEAQAALKKAVQLDAIADVEAQTASQIAQQLQTAAPGTAPLLEAQASAWLVRANAYTQSAVAELIRIHAIDLANASAEIKMSANSTAALRSNTDGVLQQGGK